MSKNYERRVSFSYYSEPSKVRNAANIRNRYNQVSHLTLDTTCENDQTQLNITNEFQEVSPFPAGEHTAEMNRRESMTNSRHK